MEMISWANKKVLVGWIWAREFGMCAIKDDDNLFAFSNTFGLLLFCSVRSIFFQMIPSAAISEY